MRDAHLKLGGRGGVTAALAQISGRKGIGVDRLEMVLNLTPTNWELLADARLVVGGELEVGFANNAQSPLAQLQALNPVTFASGGDRTYPARLDLGANLLPSQIEALERTRAGGEIVLELRLRGFVLADSVRPTPEGFEDRLEYRLKASEWMELLEGWRYAEGFLLQVPTFASRESVRANNAGKELEEAIRDMAEGRYKEAVSRCRDVLETAYGRGDKNRYPGLGYAAPGLPEAGKEERFWLARRGLWAVAHAAKHSDDTTAKIEWGRRDAQALIVMLGALLELDPPA
jgi:hypothetical protein